MHWDKYQGRKEENMESKCGNVEGRGIEDAETCDGRRCAVCEEDHFELCKRKSPLDHRESLQLSVKVSEKSLNILSAIYLATQGT